MQAVVHNSMLLVSLSLLSAHEGASRVPAAIFWLGSQLSIWPYLFLLCIRYGLQTSQWCQDMYIRFCSIFLQIMWWQLRIWDRVFCFECHKIDYSTSLSVRLPKNCVLLLYNMLRSHGHGHGHGRAANKVWLPFCSFKSVYILEFTYEECVIFTRGNILGTVASTWPNRPLLSVRISGIYCSIVLVLVIITFIFTVMMRYCFRTPFCSHKDGATWNIAILQCFKYHFFV